MKKLLVSGRHKPEDTKFAVQEARNRKQEILDHIDRRIKAHQELRKIADRAIAPQYAHRFINYPLEHLRRQREDFSKL